jgi:hypothetical protein
MDLEQSVGIEPTFSVWKTEILSPLDDDCLKSLLHMARSRAEQHRLPWLEQSKEQGIAPTHSAGCGAEGQVLHLHLTSGKGTSCCLEDFCMEV